MYAIGHALTKLDKEGGCNVMITNTSDLPRTFPKGLAIARFTIMNAQDYHEVKQIDPITALYLLEAAPHINISKKDFHYITMVGQEQDETANSHMEKLVQDVQEVTRKYEEPMGELLPPPTGTI